MEKSISYNQITVQNGKVEKIDDEHFKFTLKNEHDYPIILYKIWNNLHIGNNQEIMYKTTLESWVKLYKNYNFRNKIPFIPETRITIGKHVYLTKLYNTDLDVCKQPIMYFKTNKKTKISCGKFKQMEFVIDFTPNATNNVTPDLIKYFTPKHVYLPKANTICQTITYPHMPQMQQLANNTANTYLINQTNLQLQPYTGFIYDGVYIKNIPIYNGVVNVKSAPYLINNYEKISLPEYNGVEVNKPTTDQIDAAITKANLDYMYTYANVLTMGGKVME